MWQRDDMIIMYRSPARSWYLKDNSEPSRIQFRTCRYFLLSAPRPPVLFGICYLEERGARPHNSFPPTVAASKNFFTLSVQMHFDSIILQCYCKFHFEGTNSLSVCIFTGTPCNNLYDSANVLIFLLLPSLNIVP